jgi:hypothetical protein
MRKKIPQESFLRQLVLIPDPSRSGRKHTSATEAIIEIGHTDSKAVLRRLRKAHRGQSFSHLNPSFLFFTILYLKTIFCKIYSINLYYGCVTGKRQGTVKIAAG